MVDTGWRRFPFDAALAAWAEAVRPAALDAVAGQDWRAGGTWCVGVHALDNDTQGRVGSGPLLPGWLLAAVGGTPLDRAQISVVRPGYPRQDSGESDAGFRFRQRRDAAHLDGLLPVGPNRRRMVKEPQAFLLGVPLTRAGPGASPLVVWEGSHIVMARAFGQALAGHPPEDWSSIDVTEAYQDARRAVFETCRRRPLPAGPGEALLVHRLTLHGIAPWAKGAPADTEGRAIAYFRPPLPVRHWPDLSAVPIPPPHGGPAQVTASTA